MKKTNLFVILCCLLWANSHAQNNARADTLGMAVLNTGRNFTVSVASFGGNPNRDLIGEMVRVYDTVRLLKERSNPDSTGRKPMIFQEERRCDKFSGNVKDKIALIELNKDCDVTRTCFNAQKAGAKGIIIIHTGNDKKVTKLANQGAYKDSIRIPVFTVKNSDGDKITHLLPSVIGIKVPTIQTLAVSQVLTFDAQPEVNKSRLEWANNTGENNDFFIIQRLNLKSGVFEDIEKVANQSSSNALIYYTAYDNNPFEGDNLYRIQVVQRDGNLKQSEERLVRFTNADNIRIFPNPADRDINVVFKGYKGETATVLIYDLQGKQVLSRSIQNVQNQTAPSFC
jgi:PA domain/Secretion system C-terminal sorting domain